MGQVGEGLWARIGRTEASDTSPCYSKNRRAITSASTGSSTSSDDTSFPPPLLVTPCPTCVADFAHYQAMARMPFTCVGEGCRAPKYATTPVGGLKFPTYSERRGGLVQ